jgi:TATA-box binding protein (TBP) (component of TFIID and TFIIIB)
MCIKPTIYTICHIGIGKMIVTGAKTKEDSVNASKKYTAIIQKVTTYMTTYIISGFFGGFIWP